MRFFSFRSRGRRCQHVKAFRSLYRCAEWANSLLRPSLGYLGTLGLSLVTIIIDAGFVNRVARLMLNEPRDEERGRGGETSHESGLQSAAQWLDAGVVGFDCAEGE